MGKATKLLIVVLFIGLAGLVLPPASAQQEDPPLLLTNDLIDRLLASFEDMRALGEKYESTLPSSNGNPVSGMAMALQGQADAMAVARRNGFSDFAEWIDAMTTLGITAAFVDSGKDFVEIDAERRQALAQIEKMPMDASQKEAMRDMLMKSFGVITRVTPENFALVKARHEEIKTVLDK